LPEPAPTAMGASSTAFSSTFAGPVPSSVIRSALDSMRPGDYVAFLSYLPPEGDIEAAIAEVRQAIRSRTRAATTFGVGPRYLHSTGQYHKGGPNTILAFVVTTDDQTSTEIPCAHYSFALLKTA